MAAHRYWRLRFTKTASNGATCSCAELQLRTAVGGANVATGGTASASSTYSASYVPAYAFDGSTANWWICGFNAGMPQWVQYDFGAGNAKDIVEFVYTSRTDQFGPAEALAEGALQYSDDNATWTDSLIVPAQTAWSAGESRTFNATTQGIPQPSLTINNDGLAHRYWRIYVTETHDSSGYISASDIEFFNTFDQALVNRSTAGTIRSGFVENEAIYAFDSTGAATHWSSAQGMPQWIGKDFGAGVAHKVRRITWANRSASFYSQAPKTGYIQYADDGVTWKTAFMFSDPTTWSSYQTRSYDDGSAISTPAAARRPHVFVCT